MKTNIPQSGKAISPKERAMLLTIMPGLNPINPTEKLQKLLNKTIVPSRNYFTAKVRGASLTTLGLDTLLYIYSECKQCASDLKLLAHIQYYIVWYKELLEDGDQEDLDAYEVCFRDDFAEYDIDMDKIFNTKHEVEPEQPKVEVEPKIVVEQPEVEPEPEVAVEPQPEPVKVKREVMPEYPKPTRNDIYKPQVKKHGFRAKNKERVEAKPMFKKGN